MTEDDSWELPRESRLGLEQIGIPDEVKSGIAHASIVTIDGLFEDLEAIHDGDFEFHSSFAVGGLPEQFAHEYDVGFVRGLIVAAAELSTQFTSGWVGPASVAQALALKLFLDQAEVIRETFGLDWASDWRAEAEELLYPDLDHEWLYSSDFAGIIEPGARAPEGVPPIMLSSWFERIGDGAVTPFTLDSDPTE